MNERLKKLREIGQSVWVDSLSRDDIQYGNLACQPVEILPRSPPLAQIRRQIGWFWGFRSPIRGRDRLDADFFNRLAS